MKSSLLSVSVLFGTILSYCVADSSASSSDTLRIHVPSVASDLSFVVQDSMHTRILRNRMLRIKEMSSELKTSESPVFNHSTIGYNGLGLQSNGMHDPVIYNVFNRKMAFLLSPIYSNLLSLEDFNSETECLIAKVGLYEDLSTMVNDRKVILSSLIPDELKRVKTQYGVVTLEIVSDTVNIDFSLLDNRFSFIPSQERRPIFNDIQITGAPLLSSTRYGFSISAPEGIARIETLGPLLNSNRFEPSQIDSIIKSKIPLLDSLSSCINSTQFINNVIFSPDVHRSSYLIRTTDLGIVYLQPVSFYIGAIDRISFLWIYSSDTTFDMNTLKGNFQQTATVQQSVTFRKHTPDIPEVYITLSGRRLPNKTTHSITIKGSGIYVQTGNYNKRTHIMNLAR